jgi:methylthioribose-1-phosphate isomerase
MKNDVPPIPGVPMPVRWTDDGRALHLLDQTLLPGEERYLRLERVEEVTEAIRALRVRGAPAIGIAAALGLAMGLRARWEEAGKPSDPSALAAGFDADRMLLGGARPTAVNLTWALDRLAGRFTEASGKSAAEAVADVRREAEAIAAEDREMCRLIGEHGLELIPESGAAILTHCNAGALATGGIGTALAPIYTAHARGIPVSLFADETRPLLQGARLTAWEATRAGVPTTVITDSMAGALMGKGRVNMVLVGADRVAANGDVANKIGTYALAVLAQEHGIPFYVALPRSTFDPAVSEGAGIPVEERAKGEVTGAGKGRTVPDEVEVWNPAFDLTPAHLVTAFVTDGGILHPPFVPAIRTLLMSGPTPHPSGEPHEEASL